MGTPLPPPSFWERLLGFFNLDRKTRESRRALNNEIERLVQEVSPSIRNVRGYRKALRSPLGKAKQYIEDLVAALPGPLPLSAAGWGRESPAEPLFIDANQVRALFRESADLKTFFQKDPGPRAFALLTATCKSKTIFGSDLQGEILRRDVPQEAVDFTEHRIVGPAATEARTRLAVREGALQLLSFRAMEHLVDLKNRAEDLSEEKRLAELRLKILQAQNRSLEGLLESARESQAKADRLREMLAEITRELVTVKTELGGPEESLNQLLGILKNPGEVLLYSLLTFRLNWMGVRVSAEAADPGREISLMEVEIKNRLKRVAVLITVDREEVLKGS
jgi:hypothetical protein